MKSESVFDKIMSTKLLIRYKPFYDKHKQSLLYLFFGGLSFLFSSILYITLTELFRIEVLVANIITWLIIVAFCFVTNKTFVFEYNNSHVPLAMQIAKFYAGRLFTLGLEELILFIFVVSMCFNNVLIKIIAQIIVIITNFVISKFIVFKNSKDDNKESDDEK